MNTLSVSILLAIGFLTTSAIPNCPDRNEEFATLLPHESDCSKFYKCEAGVAVVYDCPAGLYFNPVLSVCDYPEEVDCGGSGGSAGSTSPTEGSTEGGNGGSPGGGSTVGGGSDGPDCPAEDGEFVTLFPHTDCSKFWKCDRGVAVEQNCPAGLLFNPALLVCDYPEDAGCDGTGIGGGTTPSPTQGTTDGGNGGSTGGGSTVGGGSDGPECPAEDGEFVTMFPHVDCSKFWKCNRGVAVEQNCPAGLLFNPTLLVCDYPEDAGCDGTGIGGGTTPSPTQGTTDGGNGGSTGGGSTVGGGSDGPECPAEDGEFVTMFPHVDCSKFWKCNRGVAVEQNCPAGLLFNPILLVCDYPEDAGCDGTGIGGGTTPSPTQGTTDGGNGGSTGGGSTVGGGSGGPECPAEDGEFVIMFPHVDCSKFWKCNRGVAVEQNCPAGLLFNPTLLVCDYPEDAGCDGTGIGGGTTPSPTQGTTDGGNGGSTGGGSTVGGGSGGPECPAEDGEFVTMFPHVDCSKFWKCNRGVAVEQNCPAGLLFNPTLLVCDYPEDAGCDGTGIGGGTTPSPTQGTTDGGNGGSTGGGSTVGGGSDGPECPAEDGEFVTMFPHVDCSKFWKCNRGVAVEQNCPAGLLFNPTLLVCDYPEDAGCDGTGIGGGTTPSPTQGTTDGGNGGSTGGGSTVGGGSGAPECPAEDGEFVTMFPHVDCSKFWKCNRGVAVEQNCPAGLLFNPTLLVCDYPEDAGCNGTGVGGGTTPSPTQGTTDGGNGGSTGGGSTVGGGSDGPKCPAEDGEFVTLFPHVDCSKFWKCDRGVAVEQDCPAGLLFNPTLLVCDYPEDAGCNGSGVGGGTTPSPTQGTTDAGSSSQGTTGGTTQTTSNPIDGYCQTLSCPEVNGEWVYFLPYPGDCRRFCKCDWGKPFEFTCPSNLFFDHVLDVCDFQENVACINA